MAKIVEEARASIYVDTQQAGKELTALAKEAEVLKKKLIEANKAGDLKTYKKAKTDLAAVNREMKQMQKEAFDVTKVLNNLNKATPNQLKNAYNQLKKEIVDLDRTTTDYKNKASDLNKISKELDKVKAETRGVKKEASSLTAGFKQLLPALSIGAIVAGIGKFTKAMIDANIEMQQIDKRAKIVFGQNFSQVASAADEVAEKMGLTNREFINAATNTADLLIPLNFTREQAAELSVGLQSLSGALDEWSGGQLGAAEVSNILTKAMLGENEQLKQLGIAIRKDSKEFIDLVKQKMQDGQVTKAQAEALATYELILQKSADAQSAFNDEAENLLRKKKSFQLFWKEVKEGMAEFTSAMGNQLAYLGDSWDLFMNRLKIRANEVLKTSFSTEPISNFGNAILYADKRFMNYTKTIERFGIESQQGMKAFVLLGKSVEKVYGEEGRKIIARYYKEQMDLSKRQKELAEAERQAILDQNDEATRQQRIDARKEELKALLAETEAAYEREVTALKEKRNEELITEQQYKDALAMQELLYLEAKKSLLESYGEDSNAVYQQILDRKYEIEQEHTELMLSEADKIIEGYEGQNKALEKQIESRIDAELKALSEQLKKEEDLQRERQRIYEDFGNSLGEYFGEFTADMLTQSKELGKNVVLNALDILRKLIQVSIAKATAQSFTQPDSVATFGASGAVRAGILAGLINAAFSVAKTAISQGFHTGGDTGTGGKYEPAGIVHRGEYVVASEEYAQPEIRHYIHNVVEPARVARLSGRSAYPYADGGAVGATTTQATTGNQQAATNTETMQIMQDVRALLIDLKTNGINAYTLYSDWEEKHYRMTELKRRAAK